MFKKFINERWNRNPYVFFFWLTVVTAATVIVGVTVLPLPISDLLNWFMFVRCNY